MLLVVDMDRGLLERLDGLVEELKSKRVGVASRPLTRAESARLDTALGNGGPAAYNKLKAEILGAVPQGRGRPKGSPSRRLVVEQALTEYLDRAGKN